MEFKGFEVEKFLEYKAIEFLATGKEKKNDHGGQNFTTLEQKSDSPYVIAVVNLFFMYNIHS